MDRDGMGFVVDDPKVSETDNTAFFMLSFMEPVDADIESKIPWKGLSAFIYLIIEAYHSYKGIFLQELIREASLFFEGGRTFPDYYFWKLIKWEKYSPEIAHEIVTSLTLFKRFFPDNGADNTEKNCWSTMDFKSAYNVACNEGRIVGRYDHIFLVAEREFDDCCSGTLVTLCYNANEVMVLDPHEEFLMKCTVRHHFGRNNHWLKKKNDVVYEPSFLPEPSPRPEDNPNRATCCICPRTITRRRKIQKDSDAEPTQIEDTAARTLFELENTSPELKSDLKDLFINAAVEIDISENRKAVVIYVPRILRMAFRKIHSRLVRELEKKFRGKDVLMIAARASNRGSDVQRPGSRTLAALYKAMLEDIVYPAEIVDRSGGSNITKIYLDPKERTNTEYKLETFSGVYKMLSRKDVVFEYAVTKA